MHHHELGKVIPAKVARKPRRLWMSKKWAKNDVVKKMQQGDHQDYLVVLVPMVETVRKTDSVWVQNGQNMDAPFCDVVVVVRTWMRFMMCYMFGLHVDASSLGCWARGCILCILCDATYV